MPREGIIDREFIINTTYTARAKFYNGQAGIFTYWANHWARNLQERTVATQGETARVVPMPAIRGARYINRVGPLLVITRGAEDPRFVFTHFIDRQYDKGTIQTLFTYGVEGYHYTRQDTNGPFVRNMPLWIVFLWIFSVQASLLLPLFLGLNLVIAIYASGWLALLGDFILFEPYMSRRKELWLWKAVERGYFKFIPSGLNRFTAPPGNFITWFLFPLLANSFLACLMFLF